MPTKSDTRTWRVLLLVRVWLLRDQLLLPTDVVAVVQVLPLSSDTSTLSPLSRLALVSPEMVWAAVLVIKSDAESPVSSENAIDVAVVVGAE